MIRTSNPILSIEFNYPHKYYYYLSSLPQPQVNEICRIMQSGVATRYAHDLIPIMDLLQGPPRVQDDPDHYHKIDLPVELPRISREGMNEKVNGKEDDRGVSDGVVARAGDSTREEREIRSSTDTNSNDTLLRSFVSPTGPMTATETSLTSQFLQRDLKATSSSRVSTEMSANSNADNNPSFSSPGLSFRELEEVVEDIQFYIFDPTWEDGRERVDMDMKQVIPDRVGQGVFKPAQKMLGTPAPRVQQALDKLERELGKV
jgi:hypothetical protein